MGDAKGVFCSKLQYTNLQRLLVPPAAPTAAHKALSKGDVKQVLKPQMLPSPSVFGLTRGGYKQ